MERRKREREPSRRWKRDKVGEEKEKENEGEERAEQKGGKERADGRDEEREKVKTTRER